MTTQQKQKIKLIIFYLIFNFGGIATIQLALVYLSNYISLEFFHSLSSIQKFAVIVFVQNLLFFIFLYISLKVTNHSPKKVAKNIRTQIDKPDWKNIIKYIFGGYLAFILISLGVGVIYNIIKHLYGIEIPWLMGEQWVVVFIQDFDLTSLTHIIVIWISVVLIAPIVEEIIYRWIITKYLLEATSKHKALLISAIIFASIHMERSVWWHLFILSYILSYIYYKTSSLTYCILFHMLVNALSFGMMLAMANGII